MKLATYLFLSYVLLGFIFISGCAPPGEEMNCEVQCDNVDTAPSELLDYFLFNEGSYWVYQLNGTDTTDTLSFTGVEQEFFKLRPECNYGIEPCQMRYNIFYEHSNLVKFPIGQHVSNERFTIELSSDKSKWIISHVSGTSHASLRYFLAYPFVLDEQYEQYRFLKDTASAIVVPAGEFKCLEMEMRPPPTSDGFIQSIHISKGIGLIRYEISPDQIWELVNYSL